MVYIGLGYQGAGRPSQSLGKARKHSAISANETLEVRVVERPENREAGYTRETARKNEYRDKHGVHPRLHGILYPGQK